MERNESRPKLSSSAARDSAVLVAVGLALVPSAAFRVIAVLIKLGSLWLNTMSIVKTVAVTFPPGAKVRLTVPLAVAAADRVRLAPLLPVPATVVPPAIPVPDTA